MPKRSSIGFQKCTELVFYTKISSLFLYTDVFSLTSCSISWKIVLQEEFCPFSCFLWWTTPDCVHSDPCTPNFHQFYMTWNHLTKSKNSPTASIELLLVSNSSYRHDSIKEEKNCTFFKILTGKKFKIVCRKKVFLVFKNVQNLFFTPKFLLSFFRRMSLVSHHAAFLERLFYKKNSALFLVFSGELFPIVFS